MTALGLPDFGPVQHNVSYNDSAGATRGIHAEPWDKLVSVVTGRVFGAWVDLREGEGFGTTVTVEVDRGRGLRAAGVGNSYQALEDGTAYSYLVNAHWQPGLTYPRSRSRPRCRDRVADPARARGDQRQGRGNPTLAGSPLRPGRAAVLVLGAHGQVGRALMRALPDARGLTRAELDISDPTAVEAFDWLGSTSSSTPPR
ncbi:dTDP-4-dehydrorhamnose 3,5-epimerase family protein [Janibacter melonis]|uniref:dTDP-4-dehydrorhamnose 3,5-epimerase family protein n=1 Tax=Janibacter melonis TaxID=262209 RepID=UPI0027DA2739|nr:dTDP-4-dehydrorhamnose 3,5-epimerase family protein [Janibacter melonis]